MSFIRALEKGKYTSIKEGLYSFLSGNCIVLSSVGGIKKNDFVEVMFRILEQSGVKFNLTDVNRVRKRLYMKSIKRIKSDKEVFKRYFPRVKK